MLDDMFLESVKETLIVSLTKETKHVTCDKATNQAILLQYFILALGSSFTILKSLEMCCVKYVAIDFLKILGVPHTTSILISSFYLLKRK